MVTDLICLFIFIYGDCKVTGFMILIQVFCSKIFLTHFKYTLKALTNFKNKQQKYEVMFFDMRKYVYSKSAFNTLYVEIKHKS